MSTSVVNSDTDVAAARKVLIVEDEFLIRLTLSEVLADEGYTVLEAESGDAAAAVIDANPDLAILLTDIHLPGSLDGPALVRRAREAHPRLPVIFMTGRLDVMDDMPPTERDMYVGKPYLPLEICAAVKALLAR